jgi:hypothetical protein
MRRVELSRRWRYAAPLRLPICGAGSGLHRRAPVEPSAPFPCARASGTRTPGRTAGAARAGQVTRRRGANILPAKPRSRLAGASAATIGTGDVAAATSSATDSTVVQDTAVFRHYMPAAKFRRRQAGCCWLDVRNTRSVDSATVSAATAADDRPEAAPYRPGGATETGMTIHLGASRKAVVRLARRFNLRTQRLPGLRVCGSPDHRGTGTARCCTSGYFRARLRGLLPAGGGSRGRSAIH